MPSPQDSFIQPTTFSPSSFSLQYQASTKLQVLLAWHAKLGDTKQLKAYVPPQLQLLPETLIRVRDRSAPFDQLHRLLEVLALLLHEVGRGDGDGAGDACMAMDQDAMPLSGLPAFIAVIVIVDMTGEWPRLLVGAVVVVGFIGLLEVRTRRLCHRREVSTWVFTIQEKQNKLWPKPNSSKRSMNSGTESKQTNLLSINSQAPGKCWIISWLGWS